MSENLHPHDEQWDDMPLPNQEEAWQKMKLLLDKEDEQRRFLPPWFWRYGLLALLLLGAATGGYFLLVQTKKQPSASGVKKETVQQQRREEATVQNGSDREKNLLQRHADAAQNGSKSSTETAAKKSAVKKEKVAISVEKKEVSTNKTLDKQTVSSIGMKASTARHVPVFLNEKQLSRQKQLPNKKQKTGRTNLPENNAGAEKEMETGKTIGGQQPVVAPVTKAMQKTRDSLGSTPAKANNDSINTKDSVSTKDSTKPIAAPPFVSNDVKKEKGKKKNRILLSAGIGLQQAIALNGQRSSSYNLEGKRAGLSDYLPSVYLRLQREKWFLQGEFHYNVPQPVEPFSFSQITSYHAANATVSMDRTTIQKLYYHQLPFSLNYFLLRNLSVGAGGTYNLLSGAVTKEETQSKNVTTGGETISTRIVPVKGYKDSFLYKSTAGILLQTDYHWKRISIGLRYTSNLQPFIKYTKPDGTVWEEKSQMLQAVLRFRIKG
jgi:hypothetical protein